jgi:hypothetical protein
VSVTNIPKRYVRANDLDDREKIEWRNAAQLFGIDVPVAA